jgi:hypothetical protein
MQLYNINISQPGVLASDFQTRPLAYYMKAERPKVLYNALTSKYVMWMYADNYDRTLRMAAVATSCWASGPFTFIKVLWPDRNENTTDMTLFQNATGAAFLARTYYENKTYVHAWVCLGCAVSHLPGHNVAPHEMMLVNPSSPSAP